ncbi:transcriptional repressor [Candidatus Falkowbacteria bacterium]|nr:transcriptional repressor [Candidatus Falkowbacteria bacterium]
MAKTAVETRQTNQRQLIYDYVLNSSLAHPTAEQIFQSVKKRLPRISFGTVYRNLEILEKQGLLFLLCYGKEHVRYDAIMENHYHFVCERCDKVENVVCEELLELNSQIKKRHGFNIRCHRIFFYGQCRDCDKLSNS